MTVIELYVDIDQVGSSSIPVPTYEGGNADTTNQGSRSVQEAQPEAQYGNVDIAVNLGDDGDDHNNYNVDPDAYFSEDEDAREEGKIPNDDSSNTDVKGDFDANLRPPVTHVSPTSAIPSAVPINVYSELNGM